MDNSKDVTMVEWCAGYGGIHLGLKRAIPNLRVIAYGEIEAFACANLVAKMEAGLLGPAPIWTDIKTFPCEEFRDRVDILVAGYPCQPFSAAGKRLGTEDPRHLWPHIRRAVGIIRPRICFFENVEGHISLGLSTVISDLEELGFKVSWGIFSASEVGAPHQRKRVFILAQRVKQGLEGCASQQDHDGWLQREAGRSSDSVWPSRPGEPQHEWEPPRVVANDYSAHAGHGEQRPERTLGDLSGGCGEAMGNASSKRCQQDSALRGEQQPSRTSEECGLGAAEAMGNPPRRCNRQQPTEQQGRHPARRSSEAGAMGNAASERPRTQRTKPKGQQRTSCSTGAGVAELADHQRNHHGRADWAGRRKWQQGEAGTDGIQGHGDGQTQPPLGRDIDGSANRLDHAELYTSCDNRTDELRLLGNGVVPATAKRAFTTLIKELYND